jgi:hypothetical protein
MNTVTNIDPANEPSAEGITTPSDFSGDTEWVKPGFGRLMLFVLSLGIWFGPLYFFQNVIMGLPSTGIALLMVWFALPIAAMQFYHWRMRKEVETPFWRKQVGFLVKRTTIDLIIAFAFGLIGSFILFYQILTWQKPEVLILMASLMTLFLVMRNRPAFVIEQRAPLLQPAWASQTASWAISMIVFVVFVVYFYLDGTPTFSSLSAAYAAQDMSLYSKTGHQALLSQLMIPLFGLSDAVKAYFFGNLQGAGWLVLVTAAFFQTIAFWVILRTAPVFLLPGREYRRLFVPVGQAATAPIKFFNAAPMIGVAVLVALGFINLINSSERFLLHHPSVLASAGIAETQVIQVGDRYFKSGYLQAAAEATQNYAASEALIQQGMDQQIDTSFNVMKGNVDSYLDWYYSLGGEWGRIGHLLIGELEQSMNKQLEEKLHVGEATNALAEQWQQALSQSATNRQAFLDKLDALQRQYAVHPSFGKFLVVQKVIDPAVFAYRPQNQTEALFNNMEARLGLSGASGVGGAILGQKLAQRLLTSEALKTVTKTSAKIVFNFATRKVATEAITTGVGAVAGSIVPGAGTAIGALIGAVVGGIITDKMMLTLDEAMNRNVYKQQIIDALTQQQNDLHEALASTPHHQ